MGEVFRSTVYSSNQIGKILGYFSTKFQYKLLSFYKERKVVDLIKNIKNDVFLIFCYVVYLSKIIILILFGDVIFPILW